jgi:hypothetical protein
MSTGWCKDCPSEESRCLRKEDSCTAEDKAMYSASHVDKAIVDACTVVCSARKLSFHSEKKGNQSWIFCCQCLRPKKHLHSLWGVHIYQSWCKRSQKPMFLWGTWKLVSQHSNVQRSVHRSTWPEVILDMQCLGACTWRGTEGSLWLGGKVQWKVLIQTWFCWRL